VLRAEEYIISYRAATKEARLFNETLTLSPAMTPCEGTPGESLELESDRPKALYHTITGHYDAFFSFIDRQGLHLRHYGTLINQQAVDHTILTLQPRCFTVDFNEDSVRITPLN
jgi:hypothetical protein